MMPATGMPMQPQVMLPPQPQLLTIVQAQPVYMGDPALKCYFEGCQNVGKEVCKWENNRCRGGKVKKTGGCGRRYCKDHRHKRVDWHHSSNHDDDGRVSSTTTTKEVNKCCVACTEQMEDDIAANRKCCCIIAVSVFCGMFCSFLILALGMAVAFNA